MHSIDINYLAVLVCAITSFVIGGLWYGPLFGKSWMEAVGKTEEEIKENFNPVKTYGLAFVGHFAEALVLAYLLSLTGAVTVTEGIRVGLTAWLGFTAATFYINYLFEGYKTRLLYINTGFHFVFVLVSSIILISW